jgi:hypothetical protein
VHQVTSRGHAKNLRIAVASLLCSACGSVGGEPVTSPDDATTGLIIPSDGAPSDIPSIDAGPYPAEGPHDPPQVVSFGGPVLKSPKIVPIFFASDDSATTAIIADFVAKVGQSKYWITIVSEYGAGGATSLPPIALALVPPATLDDSSIQAWLANELNSDDPTFPPADGDTIYALFYPPGVTITVTLGSTPPVTDGGVGGDSGDDKVEGGDADGAEGGVESLDGGVVDASHETGSDGGDGGYGASVQTSCIDFGGYHQNISLDSAHGGKHVPYAVIPRCASFDTASGTLKGMDVITGAASHEFIEATTDPYPFSDPAYLTVDTPHFYWSLILGGGEICDMCAQFPTSFTTFADLPYLVQRCWSNKAETNGQDPCVPAIPGEVYFNSAPQLSTVLTTFDGMPLQAQGVAIPVGQSKVVTLDLFSNAKVSGPWSVSAAALSAESGGTTGGLRFAFDPVTGLNGDKVRMTIEVPAASGGQEGFVLWSVLGSQTNYWFGLVSN